ncbi:TetR/AcrR family transcriptional regulator [Maritimibacter dapengensis]|uniref:TetR family transcriptional regulator n=1 Tax=Maritimibacter dapengensis TaxID=2836868 RepID=A0ABS6T631_9RHOB|nr:TetR/AcrR family transcriptional regulator [Maritimibacter dapengensis]MBV7380609.1 TetR family transcriptional regulator [Maritimibacter dapengensis]
MAQETSGERVDKERNKTVVTRRKQKVTRSNGDETREKILNAAEKLFGARGMAAVSLRDITGEANVTLALASYHFGSKDNLFEVVVARRAAVLGTERNARLDRLVAPDTAAILDAFMGPMFDKAQSGEPGWPSYFRVVSRLSEGDEHLELLRRYFDDTGQRFLGALNQVLPLADRAKLARGFAMVLHAMLATVSQNARVTTLSGGVASSTDLAAAYETLLEFSTAGLEALNR